MERATDGIHNDKDVWSVWIWYIPSRAVLFSFFFFETFPQKEPSLPSQNNELLPLEVNLPYACF